MMIAKRAESMSVRENIDIQQMAETAVIAGANWKMAELYFSHASAQIADLRASIARFELPTHAGGVQLATMFDWPPVSRAAE
jgi:hypothetical protein